MEETGETGRLKLVHDVEKVCEYYLLIVERAVVDVEASRKEEFGIVDEVNSEVKRGCRASPD